MFLNIFLGRREAMEDGRWKMEDGRRQMEDGRWKREESRWKMEDGREKKAESFHCQYPMPDTRCPIPNSQCPIPDLPLLFPLDFFSITTLHPTFAIAILNPNSLPFFVRRIFQNHHFFLVSNTANPVRVSATSIPEN